MKKISEAAASAARHRKWHWCRRHNGFSDMPIWRVAAGQAGLPLFQVLAFVHRLEEFANVADQRGHVGEFKPAEFGAALGMTAEEAARIYAALEHPDIGWIAFDHIATFYARNPDREDDAEAARERKRRQRDRQRGMKEIARRFARGEINENQRRGLEAELLLDARLSTALTGHAGHNVTPRDIVTVTPEQTTDFQERAVDNSEDIARGESGGSAKEEEGEGAVENSDATRWVDNQGTKLIVERLAIPTILATTHIERWRRDLRDDVALKAIIAGALESGRTSSHVRTLLSDGVRREIETRERGRQLGLMPPRPGSQPKGPEAAASHDVTSPAVDNLKRSAS